MMMKWSPWAATASDGKRKKYRVKMDVKRIEGLSAAAPARKEGGDSSWVVWVEIRWKGPPRRRGLSALRGRKPTRCLSGKKVVRDGTAEWGDSEGATFTHVCGFPEMETKETLNDWKVSIHLCVKGGDKVEEIGTAMVNLRDMVSELRKETTEGSNDQAETLRELAVVSPAGYSDAKISVAISSVEIVSVRNIRERSTARDERSGENSCTSESDASVEQVGGSTSGERRNSEKQSEPPARRGFLSWRKKRRKTADTEQEPPEPATNDWLISRDGKTKLKAPTFFASIDQRDESAGGESACTVLVVVIADKLLSSEMDPPTQPQFDALIREGSTEWRKLSESEPYASRFADKHFDLETVLRANLRAVSVCPENSYVGFFSPESFESLRGAMSFDDIWSEVAGAVEEGGAASLYIVSWNDHFFLLKVEAGAFYVIDTLGERLFEGCEKAYILKFDENSSMYGVPEKDGDEEKLICQGTDCCKEFISRFLVAIPLREELEAEEKGREGPPDAAGTLHQRLQIELHRVKRLDMDIRA